jgi:hypothetical protein
MLTVIKKPYNSILIQSDSQKELVYSLMRFQEYYENPKFRHQIFTIGVLKQWYSQQYGADTYAKDWVGFNFPSYVLDPFRQGLFDPLTKYEQAVIDLFRYRTNNFYIIGSNSDEVTKHELHHALYYYSTEYKTHIDKIFQKSKNLSVKQAISKLLNKGYHKEVVYDELQAYILDDDQNFISSIIDSGIKSKVTRLYNKYK